VFFPKNLKNSSIPNLWNVSKSYLHPSKFLKEKKNLKYMDIAKTILFQPWEKSSNKEK